MTNILNKIYTASEASRLWGVDRTTIANACRSGKLTPSECRQSDKTWLLTEDGLKRIWGNKIVNFQYELKNSNTRKNLDLTDTRYEPGIKTGVHNVFPNAIINVYPKYFEILGITNPTNAELQKMGKEIAANSHNLQKYITNYGYSSQLFRRKK